MGVTVPDQLHIGLPVDEAMAACGPVAAIAFAQVYGRNPTVAETMDSPNRAAGPSAGGMNGIANEKRLLDKMGLPSQLEMGANWDHIRADAMQHRAGHRQHARPLLRDRWLRRQFSGAYHVGQSGKVYRGGSEWMTPAQIEALAGAPSGALFAVHPLAGGGYAPGAAAAGDAVGARARCCRHCRSRSAAAGSPAAAGPGNTPPPPPIPSPPPWQPRRLSAPAPPAGAPVPNASAWRRPRARLRA